MNMNHVNLTVTDVQAATEFLKTYFGLNQQRKRTGMAVLVDDDDFVLTVMETDDQSTVTYPGTFHIGFFVESATAVDDIHSRLTADGFDVPAPTRRHVYGFYVEAPGGFTVEVGTVEV